MTFPPPTGRRWSYPSPVAADPRYVTAYKALDAREAAVTTVRKPRLYKTACPTCYAKRGQPCFGWNPDGTPRAYPKYRHEARLVH